MHVPSRTFPVARILLVPLIMLSATAACDRRTPTPAPGTEATATISGESGAGGSGKGLAAPAPTPGVSFRLSDADPAGPGAGESVPLASAEPLSADEVARLLQRLPPLPEAASEQVDFALRPGPQPPKLTGDAVKQPFPPETGGGPAPEVAAGPLEVSRYQPEGDVEMAPRLSVTFSKPMVPLTSHAALAAAEVPVTLAPQPPGEWRWAGSQTLVFEPEGGRFPMATEYTVTVPAGIKSERGDTLAQAATWTFRTPPPRVLDFHPNSGPTDRQPLLFLGFDQRVDGEALLPHITLKADGDPAALRLATAAEVEADETVKQMSEDAEAGRWVALRPVDGLPLASKVAVDVGPGLPSAEGPRTTESAQAFEFEVYGPLRVTELQCGGQADFPFDLLQRKDRATDCEPLAPWIINFSNDLDEAAFDPATVTIEPAVPGARIEASDNEIFITGAFKGRTRYQVHLPAGLEDEFGQTLGEDVTVIFETGDMRSALYVPGNDTVVLDPAGKPALDVFSINNDALKVQLYQVAPADWPAYMDARWRQNEENPPGPPGKQVWSGSVQPEAKRDEIVSVPIDLSPTLTDGLGQVLVVVEPATWSWDDENYNNRPQWRWVQATKLGLSAFNDSEGTLVWVNQLADGQPVSGAAVSNSNGMSATTNADGLATLSSAGNAPFESERGAGAMATHLVAQKGADVALLPGGFADWASRSPGEQLSWYFFTDRGLYKPGEEVHIKGLVRDFDPGKGGDVAALAGGPTEVGYVLTASNGQEIARGTLPVGTFGGFDGVLALPEDIELGYAQLQLSATGGEMPETGREFGATINVAEFRRPEFEVKVESEEPYYFIGDQGVVSAQASYYAGGPLPNAETHWSVSASPTNFTPPGRDDFYFGIARPVWIYWEFGIEGGGGNYQDHAGTTDATGTHRLAIDFDGVHPLSAASFRAEGSVMDVNRQAWTGTATFLVHPARDYVGLRADRWFVEAGDPFEIEAIVADIDGGLVAGRPIKLVAEKVDATWKDDERQEELSPAGGCDLTSADDPVSCELTFDNGGEYRVTATIADAEGRPNMTQLTLWVSGAPTVPQRGVEQQRVLLIPDKDEYQPGDTAEILVQAPFTPAEGLLSIRRSGLVKTESFHMDGPSTTLRVPVDESLMPNFWLQVDLNGAAERAGPDGEADPDLPARPAYASGSLDLKVPPLVRTLTVEATPRQAAVAPGGATTVDVTVTGADGKPLAGSEVALVVVDEAVLALDGYSIPDPVDTFYPQRGADVGESHQRAFVQLADPTVLAAQMAEGVAAGLPADGADTAMQSAGSVAPMAKDADGLVREEMRADSPMLMALSPTAEASPPRTGGGGGDAWPVVPERTDLNPLAAFVPSATTDASGKVALDVDLPDNVTRYRITAVSTDGAQHFGKGEGTLTARLPLVVRPSAPRFLNFGDAFELPVVVQNQTEADLPVDVVVRAANLKLDGGLAGEAGRTASAGRRVTVPAGDRVEVRFPAGADMPGTAALQAGAFAVDIPEVADAQRVTLPVWTPATTEAFATYGTIDEGAIAQPVQRPPDVVEQFGGLELTTSSTAVSELTDAFLYLQDYPFEGSEQVASRLIATLALKDVLASFEVEGLPSADEVDAAVRRDLDKLVAMQNSDGGWDWWRAERQSSPFATVHAAHALARAGADGYAVREDTISRAKDYLVNIEDHLRAISFCECPEAYRAIRAYALYVRALLGDRDTAKARALFNEVGDDADRFEIETLGWLLSVMSGDAASETEITEIRRRIANAASEESGTAQFSTNYSETEGAVLLGSDRRADAIVLDALMTDQPESDLIPKVVRGLLDHRENGRWGSTQENGWVLLALERYFQTFEKATPDFLARAWLGDGFVGEQAFRGRTTERGETRVPLTALPAEGTTDVTLQKDGAGRLYYRLGLRYAPEDLALDPLERGFAVERSYEAVDDPGDVRRNADGTWDIKAGSRVRVKLGLVAPARRYHVALVDPLPAGLEAVNPDLATSGTVPPNPADEPSDGSWPWWRWWRWYDHEAFRDERVEVFSNLLWDGVYDYDYIARATTPGDFVVPPTKAEELYHPETFGRGATDRVRVVER